MLNTKLLGSGIAVAVGLLVLTATNASARGDGWQLVELPTNAVAACGSTTVHVSWPVNQEYVRNLPQPNGTVIQQSNGYLVVNFATDAGGSVTLNTSGPARSIVFLANGDYEVHGSSGRNASGLGDLRFARLHRSPGWERDSSRDSPQRDGHMR